MSSGPSIATLAIPAIISAGAALAGLALSAGLNRRAQRQRQRKEWYDEAIRLARRIVYLLMITVAPSSSDERLRREREIHEAEAEFSMVTGISLHSTSVEFVRACGTFLETMLGESMTPRFQDLQRLMFNLPQRTLDQRMESTQAMYGALVHMVEVANRDLGP